MKRKILLVLLAFGLVFLVSAQAMGPGRMPPRPPAAETVTVSGSLVVAHGMPALKSGDVTYLLGGITRFVGFIDGLKEGAQITIEGSAVTSRNDSNLKILKPATLTLNGKSYDLSLPKGGLGFNTPRFHFPNHPQGSFRHEGPGGQRPEIQRPKSPRPENQRQPAPRAPTPPDGRRWQNSRP